jgi:hypothetical protein
MSDVNRGNGDVVVSPLFLAPVKSAKCQVFVGRGQACGRAPLEG